MENADRRPTLVLPAGTQSVFGNDWETFLRGRCLLASQIQPFILLFQAEASVDGYVDILRPAHLTGSEEYDESMSLYSMLFLLMACTVRTGDANWMKSVEVVGTLSTYQRRSVNVSAVDSAMKPGRELAMDVREAVQVALTKPLGEGEEVAPHPKILDGGIVLAESALAEVATIVDKSYVRMLQSLFYVATGRTTRHDADDALEVAVKMDSCLQRNLGPMAWRRQCIQMTSSQCTACRCEHLKSLLPEWPIEVKD
jgi:hypothetical protein